MPKYNPCISCHLLLYGISVYYILMLYPVPHTAKKWIFHTCGASGPEGPTPSQCSNSYRYSNVNMTLGTRGPFKGIQMWRVLETGIYR